MPFDPLETYRIADDIRKCIERELKAIPDGFPEKFSSCVSWGNQTWDNCCPGQLRVGFARRVPSSRFPNPDLVPSPCGAGERATDYLVSLLRCAPNPGPNGEPPTCQILDAHAQLMTLLEDAAWRAISCCFRNTDFNFVIKESAAIGPQGSCEGFRMTVTVGLTEPCFCADDN